MEYILEVRGDDCRWLRFRLIGRDGDIERCVKNYRDIERARSSESFAYELRSQTQQLGSHSSVEIDRRAPRLATRHKTTEQQFGRTTNAIS